MANEDALPSWPSCARAVECAGTQGREPKRLSHTSPSVTRNRRTSTPNSNGVLVVLRKCVGGRWWRHLAGGDSDPVVAGKYRQQLRKLLQDASQCTRCLRKTLTIRFMSAPTRPLAPPIPAATPALRRQCRPDIRQPTGGELYGQICGHNFLAHPLDRSCDKSPRTNLAWSIGFI